MSHMARRQIQECNLQVVNCTTPANYFHVLRRQVCQAIAQWKRRVPPPRAEDTAADVADLTKSDVTRSIEMSASRSSS